MAAESPTSSIKKKPDNDEVYLRIWEQQQESNRHRWTAITFFLSISFAIFGLSVRDTGLPITGTAQRVVALGIYWFSYLVYRRYCAWSNFLREYLEELESAGCTGIAIQRRWKDYEHKHKARKLISTTWLFLYLGFLYTIAVLILWWSGL